MIIRKECRNCHAFMDITDHVREVYARAERLEADNRELDRQLRAARSELERARSALQAAAERPSTPPAPISRYDH